MARLAVESISMSAHSNDPPLPARSAAVRQFGRWQLLQLLGKSERTMAWRVADPRTDQELLLVLPRLQPADAAALERWQAGMRQAARLSHPQLAAVIDIGVRDGWPYAAYDLLDAATFADRVPSQGLPGSEAAQLVAQTLRGLAYAHEAGVAHHDLQPFLILISDSGALRVAGLAVASQSASAEAVPAQRLDPTEPSALRAHREAATRDALSAGVLLHVALSGHGAFDEPDIGRVLSRLPPLGREVLRLPWTLAQPVADPLRAIANRATDRQERQRYRNARTLCNALEGWLQTDAGGGGPLALLADRLRAAGVLPSSPGAAARAARLARMERERTNELAEVVLQDLALAFEMLRLVNAAQVRGAQVAGSGPVLTVRRSIAMLGLDGVRHAANALRPWPGPLDDKQAAELDRLIERCKRAGRVAMALRPAPYDGEVVYLVALLQNLGRLLVQYHFPDEAQQIRRLMQAQPSARDGEHEDPGMSEEGAAYAVLGAGVEAIGAAVVRQWGLGDDVLSMVRRLPVATPVRSVDADDQLLRAVGSCANEVVDAMDESGARQQAALQRVVQRYGRLLNLQLRDLQASLQDRPVEAIAQTVQGGLDELVPAAAGSLRSSLGARGGR